MKKIVFMCAMVVMLLSVLGCGKDSQHASDPANQVDNTLPADQAPPAPAPEVKKDPVTITIAMSNSYFTDEEFEEFIVNPVKAKYPYITPEKVLRNSTTNRVEDMIARNETPDMIISATPLMAEHRLLGLDYSLDDMIKNYNLDMGRFDPTLIEAAKSSAESDQLLGMPYTMHFGALYYNKDIFNKFGVEDPPDGMTWDDAIELSKRLTRSEGGVDYRGLEPDVHVTRPASQLSIPLVDAKTQKAVLNTDDWKNVFEMLKSLYAAQDATSINNSFSRFVKDQNYAMFPSLNMIAELGKYPDLNWDMATYPVFKEAQGYGPQIDAHVMIISSTAKHKEEAFEIITVLVSDEVQMNMAKKARVPALKDPKFKEAFGQDMPYLKDKRIEAHLKLHLLQHMCRPDMLTSQGMKCRTPLKRWLQGIRTLILRFEMRMN